MKKLKRLSRPIGIAIALAGALLTLGFVERTADRTPITALDVRVRGAEGTHFIDEAAIRRAVLDQGVSVMGAPIGAVDMPAIEARLRAIPAVAAAEAYHTMDGVLHVRVAQREPVARVINADGEGFYIDREGWTMPLSDEWTARVLVVTGRLDEPGARDGVRHVREGGGSGFSEAIHRLALFVRADPLWNALFDQVAVGPGGEFELVPKVGAQRVLIGPPYGGWHGAGVLEGRLAKLGTFYEQGMPQAGWRRYARIDLRFTDQIVCTQRATPQH